MKTNTVAFAGISIVIAVALAVLGIFKIQFASAQAAATSSPEVATTTVPAATLTSSLTVATTTSSTTVTAASTTTAPTSTTPAAPAPSTSSAPIVAGNGPTLVHVIGTKYTDYFTDGTKTVAFPGDPKIDDNFDKPNAPIPSHDGMTWVHTSGGYLYDTPSGDLELNDYAQQADGSYVGHLPASTYTDATSSVALPDRFAFAGSETEMKSVISKAIATETANPPASGAPASPTVAPATSNAAATATTTTSSSGPTPAVLGVSTSTVPTTPAGSSTSAQSAPITTPAPSSTPAQSSSTPPIAPSQTTTAATTTTPTATATTTAT